jgi:hypothetical protein
MKLLKKMELIGGGMALIGLGSFSWSVFMMIIDEQPRFNRFRHVMLTFLGLFAILFISIGSSLAVNRLSRREPQDKVDI